LIIDFLREKNIVYNTIPVNLAPDKLYVEAVEKVTKQILGRDAEKSAVIEYGLINDFVLAKGQVTPEYTVLTLQNDFSYSLVSGQ